jgi:hypothetical protein
MQEIYGGPKRGRAIALAAAVVTVLLLMALVRIPSKVSGNVQVVTVLAREGVYDLTRLGEGASLRVILPEDGLCYPGVYLSPEQPDEVQPQSAAVLKEKRYDYLSQRYMLLLPDDGRTYRLRFSVAGRHAMRAYVNGALAGQLGEPGLTQAQTQPGENQLICYASASHGRMDVVLHSAQFYHARFGARLATLILEPEEQTLYTGLSLEDKGLVFVGFLTCGGLLLLGMFLMRIRVVAPLYFGLCCFAIALREVGQSQLWTKLPWISGKTAFALEYLSMALMTIFLTLYLARFLQGWFWRLLKYILLAASVAYALWRS